MAPPFVLKFKGNKSFSPFSNLTDEEALSRTWRVCTKVAQHLEQGQRLENLSWRLWYLHNILVESDNAKSARTFKKLSRATGEKLDRDKNRNIEELKAPKFRRTDSSEAMRKRAAERENPGWGGGPSRGKVPDEETQGRRAMMGMQHTFSLKDTKGARKGAAARRASSNGAAGGKQAKKGKQAVQAQSKSLPASPEAVSDSDDDMDVGEGSSTVPPPPTAPVPAATPAPASAPILPLQQPPSSSNPDARPDLPHTISAPEFAAPSLPQQQQQQTHHHVRFDSLFSDFNPSAILGARRDSSSAQSSSLPQWHNASGGRPVLELPLEELLNDTVGGDSAVEDGTFDLDLNSIPGFESFMQESSATPGSGAPSVFGGPTATSPGELQPSPAGQPTAGESSAAGAPAPSRLHRQFAAQLANAATGPQVTQSAPVSRATSPPSNRPEQQQQQQQGHQPAVVNPKRHPRTQYPRPSPPTTPGGSAPGGARPECSNCGALSTPLWRRSNEDELLCNACGLYLKLHKSHRPKTLKSSRSAQHAHPPGEWANGNGEGEAEAWTGPTITCANCETSTTPLWRKAEDGSTLCNACGLYLKLHKSQRPLSMKTDVIKKRTRYDPIDKPKQLSLDASPSNSPAGSRMSSPVRELTQNALAGIGHPIPNFGPIPGYAPDPTTAASAPGPSYAAPPGGPHSGAPTPIFAGMDFGPQPTEFSLDALNQLGIYPQPPPPPPMPRRSLSSGGAEFAMPRPTGTAAPDYHVAGAEGAVAKRRRLSSDVPGVSSGCLGGNALQALTPFAAPPNPSAPGSAYSTPGNTPPFAPSAQLAQNGPSPFPTPPGTLSCPNSSQSSPVGYPNAVPPTQAAAPGFVQAFQQPAHPLPPAAYHALLAGHVELAEAVKREENGP